MEGVSHRTVCTNGILMHVAEKGSGPVVLFLHGFPEGWFGWRKQIPTFASAGYRVIAPDLRGYGDTSAPEGAEHYTYLHIVGDLIGLLDALEVEKAFVVGHDWGALIGWQFALLRPDRIIALANLSVHHVPRDPKGSIVKFHRETSGEDHYMCKFQVPGELEALIARVTFDGFLRNMFVKLDPKPDWSRAFQEKVALPEWMSEEELAYCVSELQKHGFTPALNYYRALDLSWELTAAWTGSKVMVPCIFMTGDKDIVYKFAGAKDYIHGKMAADVPLLKEITILEGVQHFLQLEKPEVVNNHILQFFKGF